MQHRRHLGTMCLSAVCLGAFAASFSKAEAGEPSQSLSDFSDIGAIGVPVAAGLVSLFKKDYDGALELGLSWTAAVGATWALKKTVNATRPNGEPESFPSRHAASAFSGASYLQYRYGWKFAAPAYVVAVGVGYARVENDDHYWRDVAVAAALANLSAWLLTSEYGPSVPINVGYDMESKTYLVSTRFRF
jgi:PAP2 superfamily protein